MGFLQACKVPALDNAGIALTLALTGNVDLVTCFKYVCFDDLAQLKSGAIIESEFLENSLGRYVSLLEVTLQGLRNVLRLDIAETDLDSFIQIAYEPTAEAFVTEDAAFGGAALTPKARAIGKAKYSEDENGKAKRRKRFGRSIRNRCPGYFQQKAKEVFDGRSV